MYYDDIDQYVDRFYREKEEASNPQVIYGEVIEGDWREEQFDLLTQQLPSHDYSWENFWNLSSKKPVNRPQRQSSQTWFDPNLRPASGRERLDQRFQPNERPLDLSWSQSDYQSQPLGFIQERALTCAEWAILGGIGILMVLLLLVIT